MFEDFLGNGKEEDDDVKYKEEETTLLDNVAILTELKCLDEIKRNSFYFYAFYELTKGKVSKSGKYPIYKNLKKVFFKKEDLPKTKINEDGTGTEIIFKKFEVSSLRALVNYLSYDSNLFFDMFQINKTIDYNSNEFAVLKYLEKIIPKRKYYIKNLGSKANDVTNEKIKMISEYFEISQNQAKEYINTLAAVGRADDFLNLFWESKSGKKKKIPNKVEYEETEEIDF